MARSMTDVVDIHEWKDALNELKSGRGQPDMKEDVFRILRYSYDRLYDKRVQECFLSCILYGADVLIRRTILIDLWINEGLLDGLESRDTQVAKGHVILNNLESSCLLESHLDFDKKQCVKMHDSIRDMAIIITKEHPVFMAEARKQLEQVPEEEKWSKNLAKVSLYANHIVEIPSGMAPMTPNLTVLMLNVNPLKKIPDSFFVHMRALTLLDLSQTYIERVPESVSDLENLRGLLLSYCAQLEYVPSVAKLTKLRTLDLFDCWKLEEAPSGLERLKCVETISYIPWDVSNVIGFNELIQSLTLLVHYRFRICNYTSFAPFSHDIQEYEKVVWIRGGEFGVDKSRLLVPNTFQLLDIGGCDMKGSCLGDVIQSVTKESVATGVKELRIEDCRGLESISGTKEGTHVLWGTSQLEVFNLPDLRSIAKPGVPHSFSHLRRLCISGCPKLKVVFPMTCSNQLQLPCLSSIEVSYCEQVEEIFGSNTAILPNLKELTLWKLPKLKVIFPTAEQLQLPCLSSIDVSNCEEVEEIFGSNQVIIPNLMMVELRELPKLEVIFPFTEKLHLPNLESIYVRDCKDLREIFGSNEAIIQSSPILSLSNLKDLELIDLPKLKVIIPITKELHLLDLKSFVIRGLPELDYRSLPNIKVSYDYDFGYLFDMGLLSGF